MSNPTPSHRIHTFDLLRGLAVLTMMLAHSVYFFHSRDSEFLLSLEGFGNAVSFVTFLVVSGAVTWVAYFRGHPERPVNRRRVFGRVVLFLIAYYVLALVLSTPEILKAGGFDRLRVIGNILSFRSLPGFTEYFPPFIFYAALVGFFPDFFRLMGGRIVSVVGLSAVAWLVGMAVSRLDFDPVLRPWVVLLAGGEGVYRFPLLQYLPVFMLGLYWGHRTQNSQGLEPKLRFVNQCFWWSAFGVAAGYALFFLQGTPLQTVFQRWPPSIPFLALGLSFAFFIASVLYRLNQLRSMRVVRDVLLLLGQNAVGLFWSHIFLLGLYAMAGGDHVSSIGLFVLLFLLLLLVSLALTTFLPFNFRLALTSAKGSHEEYEAALNRQAVFTVATEAARATTGLRRFFFPDPAITSRRTLRARYKIGLSLVAIAAVLIIFPATTEELALQQQERGSDVWWSDLYAYRQPLSLQSTESFVTLQSGNPVSIEFDHQALVEQRKSQADGADLRLVYWTGKTHIDLDHLIRNANTKHADLTFRIPTAIEGQKPSQFYALYYGGFAPRQSRDLTFENATRVVARFETEDAFPLVASVATHWSLIGQPENDFVRLNLSAHRTYQPESVTYQILDQGPSGIMDRSTDNSWEARLPVAALPAGTYRIQATVKETGGQIHTSQITGFSRSHPLYVAWTHDWEGYDVNQAYLVAMEDIATQYQLPITQFFNPRIFVTETIRPERARALTRWVQRRLELGDGFGLHLHMLKDYVEYVGIPPKDEPNWGDRGDGYGVPLSAYSKDEQRQLIETGQRLLFEHGLPRATIFRAGGWFANLDTFRALEDLGITVDSSARTAYQFGRNRLPGHWNILATTQPYYPSRTNQNASGSDNFPVLEIPNNGADSYAFGSQAMLERFYANFGNGILNQPLQVTYLSHPHWFNADEQTRVREVLSTIDQHVYSHDRGPVIYATLQTIAELWSHAQ